MQAGPPAGQPVAAQLGLVERAVLAAELSVQPILQGLHARSPALLGLLQGLAPLQAGCAPDITEQWRGAGVARRAGCVDGMSDSGWIGQMPQQAGHIGDQGMHVSPQRQHRRQRRPVQRIDLGPPGVTPGLCQQAGLVGTQFLVEQAARGQGMFSQHALAPGVDGVHGGFVHGLGRHRQAPGRLLPQGAGRMLGQQLQQQGIVRRGRLLAAEAAGGVHQAGADAVAQLTGGGTGEGHHQDLRGPQGGAKTGVGIAMAQHQAQVDGRNRPGLAGAGAGLDQAAAPQRQAQGVEWLRHRRPAQHGHGHRRRRRPPRPADAV